MPKYLSEPYCTNALVKPPPGNAFEMLGFFLAAIFFLYSPSSSQQAPAFFPLF